MKKNNRIIEHIRSDELAKRIAGNIMDKQNRIADYLNERTSNLSGKALLLALIGFCTVFGSYCLYLLINAIN